MFDGVPVEHFHRFISTPSSRIPPNSSLIQTPPISTSTNLNFLSFDPLLFPPLNTHHQTLFQTNHFVQTTPTRDQYNDTEGKVDQEIDQGLDVNEPWSNDEVIQLLRIKSSSENWFKDLTWDHVSRKLAEMGYKRSSEKCKEKFEEETCRSFNNSIECNKSRYLISEELDHHLCNNSAQIPHENVNHQEHPQPQEKEVEHNFEAQGQKGHFEKDPAEIMSQPTQEVARVTNSKKRKRKHKKFKMVKGLCIDLVNKMMAQQEEMHKKLLEDMANRDEEKNKREEAWRKEEMERVQTEIHMREHEQEMARDRQSTITEFLNKITSLDKKIQLPFNMNLQDLQALATSIDKPTSSLETITENPNHDQSIAKDDTGRRWPRDEVLALISIRSNVNNGLGGNSAEHHEGGDGCGGAKGSLWERISQGMLELGYQRSAKRCKEKWENINKYFRKTKDANKKRSLESRTCPYYHELSKLYNQEKLASSQELLTTKSTTEN
ncbi:trihelix transcription factor GTL2-like [Bidens hawaiensis]|uniref:trihelix transcription factor GTL2-like n=1 Tax=Bidens hawaiensis TaxID=980011 RepID=UPI00404A8D86